jgi:hypothetical protein
MLHQYLENIGEWLPHASCMFLVIKTKTIVQIIQYIHAKNIYQEYMLSNEQKNLLIFMP